MIVIEIGLLVIGVYLTVYALYLLLLLVASLIPVKELTEEGDKKRRFAVIIPAHNEEMLIEGVLSSIRLQRYPKEHFDAVVIADNCTDKTASIALENGAVVYKRNDLAAKGKGYALKFGIESIFLERYDAVVIVDADCILDTEVLGIFDKYLRSGYYILQGSSAPANPGQSWFTRLSAMSHSVSNEIILKGKKRLGFSIPLMGQGMCFSSEIFKRYGWSALSVGEDLEFYGHLISDGHRIMYAKEAKIFHHESHNLQQATSQRMRWSSSRFAVAFKYGLKLLFVGMKEMNIRKLDGSLALLFPNPSLGINLTLGALVGAAVLCVIGLPKSFPIWFLALSSFQAGFFMLGIIHSKEKIKDLQAIFWAPVFLAWKMIIDLLSVFGIGGKKWVPTKRTLPK